jgi:predicted secreted hydrolase
MNPLRLFIVFTALVAVLCAAAYLVTRSDEQPVEARLTVAEALSSSKAHSLDGYLQATEPRAFVFPADHAPHEGFKTEWWYFTGNLQSASGRAFGYQLTFFRSALAPPQDSANRTNASCANTRVHTWSSSHIFMAHFALTDVQSGQFYSFERFSREAQGLAGATLGVQASGGQAGRGLRVWVEDWSASTEHGRGVFPLRLHAAQDGIEISLLLDSLKPASLQGNQGLSQKGAERGNASYYYSMTRLPTQGLVRLSSNSETKSTNESMTVTGESWMDREWSTSALSKGQVGWDWFALHLHGDTVSERKSGEQKSEDFKEELMYYQLRKRDGRADSTSAGSITLADGHVQPFRGADVQLEVLDTWKSPRSGVVYPARWQLRVPREGVELTLTPLVANQELNVTVRYWEGAVRVEGTRRGRPVRGRGYAELTGYAATTQ